VVEGGRLPTLAKKWLIACLEADRHSTGKRVWLGVSLFTAMDQWVGTLVVDGFASLVSARPGRQPQPRLSWGL